MIRLPAFLGLAIAGIAVAAYFAFSGGGAPQISKDVSSVAGDGLKADSLFHAAPLGKAIGKFNDKFGNQIQITNLKIEANSLKATTDHGIQVVGKHGGTENLSSGSIDTSGGQAGFSMSKVTTSTLDKIVKSLAGKGVGLGEINYFLVQTTFDGSAAKPGWLIYTFSKGNFEAHYDGTNLKTLGAGSVSTITTGSTSTSDLDKAAKNAQKTADKAVKGAQSTADCISKAGTDASKIAACAGQ